MDVSVCKALEKVGYYVCMGKEKGPMNLREEEEEY